MKTAKNNDFYTMAVKTAHAFIMGAAVMFFAFAKAQSTQSPARDTPAAEKPKPQVTAEREANYRQRVATQARPAKPAHNLGNLHYRENRLESAGTTYARAIEKAATKAEKHRLYHNLGNVYLDEKRYELAEMAYKEALRNNPKDDETRYNLAIAKQKKDDQSGGGGGNQGGGNGQQEQPDKNKQQGQNEDPSAGNEQESPKGQNSEGEGGQDPQQPDGREKGETDGKLTPAQMKRLLDALENEESKVQQKIKGNQQKGRPNRTEKDW